MENKSERWIELTIAEPDYYADFHCIGSDCRNNCCNHTWRITVDKQTYKRYRNAKASPSLTEGLHKFVIRNRQSKGENDVAYLLQVGNPARCGLETEDGLCSIQKELGEDYLCTTCRVYPRQMTQWFPANSIMNILERGCDVSCEALAHLFLHRQEPIQVTQQLFKGSLNQAQKILVSRKHYLVEKNRPMLSHFFLIQTYAIALLQDRNYAFEDRLILLAYMFRKLHELEKSHTEEDTPRVLEEFAAGVESKLFAPLLDVQSEVPLGDLLGGYLSAVSFFSDVNMYDVAARLKRNMKSIVAGKNAQIRREVFDKMLPEREVYIEHLFVNQLFVEALPFFTNLSIWENAKMLVGTYIIFRFLLEAYAVDGQPLDDVEIVDITAYWGKALLHGVEKLNKILELFDKNDFDSVAHLAVLLKS